MRFNIDDYSTRDEQLEVGYLFLCLHDHVGVCRGMDDLQHRKLARLGGIDEDCFFAGTSFKKNEGMMDTQTTLALVVVFVAAVVLSYRFVVATKRTLLGEGCGSSGCGSCSGCPSRDNSRPDRGERELVLVALQKSPK